MTARQAATCRRVLAPVWQALVEGQIDSHDERAIATALRALPQLPTVAQVRALDEALHDELTIWEEYQADGAARALPHRSECPMFFVSPAIDDA